jgi:FkbM family methyltransferase
MIAKQLARLWQYLEYRKVFADHHDIIQYRRGRAFKRNRAASDLELEPRPIRVKDLGDVVLWCRPGTVDYITLWDTFFYQYHLPLRPLANVRRVVDLGANIGLTALSFALRYPQADVLAVEMDANNATLCARNLAPFSPRCQVLQAAVWSNSGAIEYEDDSIHLAGHRVSNLGTVFGGTKKRAPAKTIDEIFRQFDITHVDYLKIDIEGAEAEVFRGQMGWARQVRSLGVEIHPPATYEQCQEVLSREGLVCERHHRHKNSLFAYRR